MIQLSWPAKALSPNYRSRSHWPKTNATAAAVKEAYWATKAAMGPGSFKHHGERLRFLITAYPPTRAARDDDNMTASCKPLRDGIARALGIDDKYFDQRLQWGEPAKGGRIVVTISSPCDLEVA